MRATNLQNPLAQSEEIALAYPRINQRAAREADAYLQCDYASEPQWIQPSAVSISPCKPVPVGTLIDLLQCP